MPLDLRTLRKLNLETEPAFCFARQQITNLPVRLRRAPRVSSDAVE